jgi:hypothetical protein
MSILKAFFGKYKLKKFRPMRDFNKNQFRARKNKDFSFVEVTS